MALASSIYNNSIKHIMKGQVDCKWIFNVAVNHQNLCFCCCCCLLVYCIQYRIYSTTFAIFKLFFLLYNSLVWFNERNMKMSDVLLCFMKPKKSYFFSRDFYYHMKSSLMNFFFGGCP